MAEPRLLGVDVGTTAVKAVVIASTGEVLGQASAEYALVRPQEAWVEQDAEDWWRLLVACTREACRQAGGPVRALALSTQGDTAVPVDARGRAIRPAITWLDTRAADEAADLRRRLPEARWRELTGTVPGAHAAAVKVPWLRAHEPNVLAGMSRYALVSDFLHQRLTGQAVADLPNASRTLALDLRTRQWSPELLEAFGLSAEALPRVEASGEPIGPLRPEAAAELDLPEDTLVCTGGHDQTCAAVGAGVTQPGEVLLSCGTAWVVLAPLDALPAPDRQKLAVYCHAVPEKWVALGAYAGGSALNWLRDELARGEDFEGLDEEAAAAAQGGRLLFLPHFYGRLAPEPLPQARGALVGLNLHTTRGDIVRALFEGVAFETRTNVLALREMGAAAGTLRMIGGGARSHLWAQIVADVCGVEVALPTVREAAAYGAALLAGVGAGLLRRTGDLTDRLETVAVCRPEPEAHERYSRQYGLYREAVQALAKVAGGLAAL